MTSKDVSGSTYPVVSASTTNNAVIGYTDDDNYRIFESCLCIGQQTAFCTYQNGMFIATNNALVLEERNEALNSESALFVATCINNAINGKFNYGRKLSAGRAKDVTVCLPITPTGDPDYDFMERYIKSLPFSSVIDSLQS